MSVAVAGAAIAPLPACTRIPLPAPHLTRHPPPPLPSPHLRNAVHAKLVARVERAQWNPDKGQDFEDSHGNVLDRKTYEDLAKMGYL